MRSRKPSTNISLTPCRPDGERRALAQSRRRPIGGIEPRQHAAKVGVPPVPQDERLRHRVAERSDAELQRAAIGHRARDVQAGGVFGEVDRLARRRKQRKLGWRALQHQIEFVGRDVGVARHERQLGIDLPDEQEVGLPALAAWPADRA